ncbi:uncharacterized protein METZ01_LOCUS356049 [marine metagenome]|uniref:Divalent-cation tolerance protein CutA n=1 Tax=marine metagenome TaxID=408172 RepID=A0A382S174_9ZZZZ
MSLTVYTTAPDEKTAEALAKKIVAAKLGACCNFWPVRTIYSWEGKLKNDTEHVIFIKTSKKKYQELEKYIVKNHPYSMPAVVSLPWDDAYKPFKDWVNNDE